MQILKIKVQELEFYLYICTEKNAILYDTGNKNQKLFIVQR